MVIFDRNQRTSLLKTPFFRKKTTSFKIANFDKKCPIVFSQKIHFRIKNGNCTHHKLYKENISCRQKVRFRSKINSLVFSLIALRLKIAGNCVKMCKSLWFFEIFLKFSDSLGFLGFKRWNYTVRWVVNGTILKGFDAMAPFFGALLVFSSTLSWWEMVENLSLGGRWCFLEE